jgi:uncharacterized membrane protein
MSWLDWLVLIVTTLFIVVYGAWKTRGSKDVESYLLGERELKWWVIGISIMATQASGITFLSTPGQAYADGMRFAQFYLGLPLAMVILAAFVIPIYYRLKVYTAYEYLEHTDGDTFFGAAWHGSRHHDIRASDYSGDDYGLELGMDDFFDRRVGRGLYGGRWHESCKRNASTADDNYFGRHGHRIFHYSRQTPPRCHHDRCGARRWKNG